MHRKSNRCEFHRFELTKISKLKFFFCLHSHTAVNHWTVDEKRNNRKKKLISIKKCIRINSKNISKQKFQLQTYTHMRARVRIIENSSQCRFIFMNGNCTRRFSHSNVVAERKSRRDLQLLYFFSVEVRCCGKFAWGVWRILERNTACSGIFACSQFHF